ncbi:leucyl aminopeptidase [Trueperella bialowiezensis]|uniref:Probable cytosol aminopeptidase n=1 Tax=Trueperella bialowiezensis TaxID=312285 RepID=A0A3S5EVY2_9ACTO|nr:leucyl aminopeptidase [Trueperella bialowiezensis]VEI12540.1 Cytosol aminopeptidase [Trueperella bialowiezensis]
MTQIETKEFSQDLARNLAVVAAKKGESFTLNTLITDKDFVSAIETALATLDASGVVRLVNPADTAKLVFVVVDPDSEREAFGELVRAAAGVDELVVASAVSDVAAAVEGALTGGYVFDEYKQPKKAPLGKLVVSVDDDAAVTRGQVLAEQINRVRDLVNLSPSELVPETLAQIAEDEAGAAGLDVKVYREDELEELGLVGLLQVGRGSANPPRLVRIEWKPEGAQGSTTALVGKGITFDTGGYSLKPSNAMTEMKTDMAGAATVLNTIIAAARLGVKRHVVAWMCLAENMVSGTAGHPDDVIVYRNGKSVEIDNTDAEGRLVLADGLIMASEEKADKIIDIATLTGAQMVALGERYTGVMGSDEYAATIAEVAGTVGEDAWHMPLPAHLRDTLDSNIADMKNSGGSRFGGMLTAGLFLKEFVDAPKWAHLDIAGPSFNRTAPRGATPKGATGVMLRTMLAAIERDA